MLTFTCYNEKLLEFTLTPSHSTALDDVKGDKGVEDLDQCEVHVHSLQSHPGERCQQEVVQCCSSEDAQAIVGEGREPGVEKEDQAQAHQCCS